MKLFLVFAMLTMAASLAASPTVNVTGDVVHVGDVSPGATVALFGATRIHSGSISTSDVFRVCVKDDDRDGKVEFKPEHGLGMRTIVIAVDVQTGEFGVGSPHGYTPQRLALPDNAFQGSGQSGINKIEHAGVRAELVIVRAGVGAWMTSANDGGRRDADHRADGRVQIFVRDMTPISESPVAPDRIDKGDIVAVIDPREMVYFVAKVGEK